MERVNRTERDCEPSRNTVAERSEEVISGTSCQEYRNYPSEAVVFSGEIQPLPEHYFRIKEEDKRS